MIELNKIYNEDCLETMKRMESNSVDYCLTSPPYNISATSKGLEKYNDYSDDLSSDDYFTNQSTVIEQMLRITKKHIFYNIQMVSGNKLALHKLIGHFADKIKEVIIWNKGFGQPAICERVFNSAFEYIIILSNKDPGKRYFEDANFDRGTQSNLFKIKNKHFNSYSKEHDAVMPLDVPRYFIQNFGTVNEIWHDPYLGTGTTAIAAIKEKRDWIGSEISKEYCDIAQTRINIELSQMKIF